MNGYPRNGKGEGHDPDTAETEAPVSQETAFRSQQQMVSQRYPETTNRDDEQRRFGVPRDHYSTAGVSNLTLEHALGGLTITGLDVRQNPLLDTQWRSQALAQTQGMNGDLYASPSNAMEYEQNNQFQRSFQNNSVDGSNLNAGIVHSTYTGRNSPVHMLNNGFLNINLGAVPYFPRNHSIDQLPLTSTNGLGSGINGLDTSPPVNMLNNGFSNGNLRAVPYFPRNHSIDQWPLASTNGLGSGINGSYTSPPVHMLNNGFLNGNLGDVPYPPRNPSIHQWPLASTNGYGSHRIPPVYMPNNGFPNGNLGHVPYNLPRTSSVDQRSLTSTSGFGSGNNVSLRRNGSFQRARRRTQEILNGSIVSKAKNAINSPLLQTIIEEGSRPHIDMIFNEVIFYICDLMLDPVAHYVIQKLLEKCSVEQINNVLDMVLQNPHITVRICADSLGTRAIQLLLECLQSEEQISRTVEALSLQLLELTRNNHSKYVILECFNKFSPLQNMRLFEEINNNCYKLASDQNGCCILQHCLRLGLPELKQLLLSKIIPNVLTLSVDNYGNYVVQYLMEMEDEGVIYDIMTVLNGNYAFLAQNKYGSHTVQKLLRVNGVDTTVIVHELLDAIKKLVFDQFGNYVIQTAWDVCQENMRVTIRCCLQEHIKHMRCDKFGKKVLDKMRL